MKKLLLFVIVAMLFVSCGKKEEAPKETPKKTETITKVTVENFKTKAVNLVNKKVQIEGTVLHVCTRTGKRCFIGGNNSDVKIKIEADEEIGTFPMELEGSTIVAIGKVTEFKVDEAYLDNWAKEVKETKEEAKGKKKIEADEIEHSCEISLKRINDYRKQIKEGGKGYIGFYSIDCSEYKTKEEEAKK